VSSADISPKSDAKYADSPGVERLSIALIGPDGTRRAAVRKALVATQRANVREFDSYPPEPDYIERLLASSDVILLDLDSDPDVALALVKNANSGDAAKFIVYSENADPKLAVRTMHAGVREYLLLPLERGALEDALKRTAKFLRERDDPSEKPLGNLLVFTGSKGGSGATTVACNVAIALAQRADQRVLLIDLALPIGDAALCLGIAADFSTEDALRNFDRLDARYLQSLLVKHPSRVFLLAAPTQVPEVEVSQAAVDKLTSVARRHFDHVVVDVGSRIDVAAKVLFQQASTIYLVTQTGISELRNSNRLISQFFTEGSPNLEIVVNRIESRFNDTANEDVIAKALGRPVRWKFPDDQSAVRALQNGDTGHVEARISRISLEMASSITGLPIPKERKKEPEFRGSAKSGGQGHSGKSGSPRIPTLASMTSGITWPTPNAITYGERLTETQLCASASVAGSYIYTPGPNFVLPVGTHTLWVTFTPAEGGQPQQAAVSILVVKATPVLSWPTPDEIAGGTALDETQLNASAPVPGKFEYSPAAGHVLTRGTHTLKVTFTPDDDANYTTAEATVGLTVAKITPVIEWPAPGPITYGELLSAAQLCATASVPGTFDYNPSLGAVLAAGQHKLSVVFSPRDSQEYSVSQASVSLTVAKATPTIEWPIPAPIAEGLALSAVQLNARASVPGSLAYKPALGAKLAPGAHNLSVTFTPADSLNYTAADAAVPLTVTEKLPSLLSWQIPSAIAYGTALSDAQLNAKASVPGTFAYAPSAGHVLAPGKYTLTASFTPQDAVKFAPAQVTVELEVQGASGAEDEPAESDGSVSGWSGWIAGREPTNADPAPADPAPTHDLAVPEAAASVDESVDRSADGSPDSASLPAEPADEHSEWSFLTNASIPAASTPVPAETSPKGDGTSHGDSSFTAAEERAYEWTFTTSEPARAKPPAETNGHAATPKGPLEIRKYKGAIYEKREDGQWHLRKK
jgi:Flp pilus assembly CpaE family ATPase